MIREVSSLESVTHRNASGAQAEFKLLPYEWNINVDESNMTRCIGLGRP